MNNETFYDIFHQLNNTPRPSHHEERVADYLCNFAESHGLRYRRDAQNCVVIEKDATPGHENAEPIVILNHMDMVCVAKTAICVTVIHLTRSMMKSDLISKSSKILTERKAAG